MNLIYYNSFAEHMRKTYTSDCSIYLESRGVMELMAGAELPEQLLEQYLGYIGPKYIVSESRLPLMGTENTFLDLFSAPKRGKGDCLLCFRQNAVRLMREILQQR